MKISKETRNNIFDILKIENISWSGKLNDIDFLNRLFDLSKLPSSDSRFENMSGDVWQHRINNPYDWEDDWVFYDSRLDLLHCEDSVFLQFLCEMLHPVVRKDKNEAIKLQQSFNECLSVDGFELIEKTKLADRPVFSARKRLMNSFSMQSKEISEKIDEEYVTKQINMMESAVETNPYIAIGLAKELIETICKTILKEQNVELDENWKLNKLMKETAKTLKLTPDDIPNDYKTAGTIKGILGNLSFIVQGLAELRNSFGSGHGKEATFKGLKPRHSKLAVGAATTLAVFLLETHYLRNK